MTSQRSPQILGSAENSWSTSIVTWGEMERIYRKPSDAGEMAMRVIIETVLDEMSWVASNPTDWLKDLGCSATATHVLASLPVSWPG